MFKDLLSTPTTQLGKAGRFAVFQIKLWSHCARLLKKNRAGQQAAALSYHTIFGIVPLAIVMLLIFQSVSAYEDVGRNVRNLIYEHLNLTEIKFRTVQDEAPASATEQENERMLTEYINGIVESFFAGLNKGSLTLVSLVIVVWAALRLLSTIERAFNSIWHVAQGRSFLHRMINYWAILTLGPLLIGLGVYVSTRYASVGELQRTIIFFSRVGPVLVSYSITTVAFFLLYFVLPNTKVHAKAAIWGALIAALLWTLAKWGFSTYVTKFIPYSEVYGVVGLIPLAVLWIFITWLIVLFGLQLTFTTQHLKTLDAAEIASSRKTEEYFVANDMTAINIVRHIALAFRQNNAPLELEVLCNKLDMPGEFGQKLLTQLVDNGIVARTSDPRTGYIPAREPANIRLSEIVQAVSDIEFAQPDPEEAPTLAEIDQRQRDRLSRYNLSEILDEAHDRIAWPDAERFTEQTDEAQDSPDTQPSDETGRANRTDQ